MEILERLAAGREPRQRLSRVAGVGLRKSGTPAKAEDQRRQRVEHPRRLKILINNN